MAEVHVVATTVNLAGQSADLATNLSALKQKCSHDTTAIDIMNIAGELALLSTTLWRLHEAITSDPGQYTFSFNMDLMEITRELTLVFEEISECCSAMQQTDTATTAVLWFFNKRRISRLKKHLEALKTTLVVMRTVLWHGKDYGTQNSPGRLAEDSPYTMHEDRVVLESVLARNRNAIIDLHNLEDSNLLPKHVISTSCSDEPGKHHRGSSRATGDEVRPIPDVLPKVSVRDERSIEGDKREDGLFERRFSKRGVRLGVHMSILDFNAHQASTDLRKKWIAKSRTTCATGSNTCTHDEKISTCPDRGSGMARISEADSQEVIPSIKKENIPAKSGTLSVQGDAITPELTKHGALDEDDKTSAKSPGTRLMSSPMGISMRKVVHRLSISGSKHPKRNSCTEKSRAFSESPDGDSVSKTTVKEKVPLIDKICQYLEPSPLTTPMIEKEFENGV